MKRCFHFRSIRSSMLICFLPVIVTALLVVYVFSFRYTEENVLNNSVNDTLQLIEQVNHDIDSYISYMENISFLTAGDGEVLEYLFSDTEENRAWELRNSMLDRFRLVREARDDIYNVGVIAADGKTLINEGGVLLNPYVDIRKEIWYQKALKAEPGTTVLSSSHVQNVLMDEYPWVVTMSSPLRYPGRKKNEGVFFIDLNYKAIEEQCERIDLGSRGYVFILDQNGNILYHPKQQLIYSGLKEEKIKEVMECGAPYFLTGKGREQKLYTIFSSEKTGWTAVGVAYTEDLLKNRHQTRLVYTLVTILVLMIMLVIVTILSKRITRPVTLLQNTMKKVEKGNFEMINLAEIPDNEIGSLGRSFNMMSEEIRNLMAENVREQELKRKSEMRVLMSQINPHFLYNTLDSIVWMAEAGKNREVVSMTMALARLLRRSISNDQEVITIAQEVEYVENYLKIQQMRYKDKLEYEIDMEEAVLDKPIIKLVLQPLAENAIYHGIKYKDTRGILRIEGRLESHEIVLRVIDNGKGMTKEQLAVIFDKHKVNYERNGVGIYNVETRLKLYYGTRYGLYYESEPDVGTIAIIRIPDKSGGGEAEAAEDD